MSEAAGSTHTPAKHFRSELEEYEDKHGQRLPFILTWQEVKLLGITGVGFFLDAYDLFIINSVSTIFQYTLNDGKSLPALLQGFMKAGANIGSVVGQILFGYLATALGRKAVYGKELIIIIIGTILTITLPTGKLSVRNCLIYVGCFRILAGIGVGADYPISASVASDRTSIRKRGTFLGYIFANQGWGNFAGGLVSIIVLACYESYTGSGTRGLDGAWRIYVGLGLVPAFATLYQRLVLPEARRFVRSTHVVEDAQHVPIDQDSTDKEIKGTNANETENENELDVHKAATFREFLIYFSEWRHAKILIGTSMCWFLLDIAFYGINLNQNVVLEAIGYAGSEGTPWHRLFKIATGGIIITALGFVPGYYVSIVALEYMGRRNIQLMGFLLTSLFLGVLAGCFSWLSDAAFIVCFTFLQFFFNFGANTTTFLYPAEVFPTRYKALAHGISAACGKIGSIISSIGFNQLIDSIGTANVLWIFFAVSLLGVPFTLLLPEVKGRDPDEVFEQELQDERERAKLVAARDGREH
ncbi:MFS general substrate transporter [Fistulina hepatica ATCC 64428]|uniref:MFS general substrate transporter n=1 Tax=Fistulina hepatica ATCC 64428 TaxID=1128425 RepID=A0A0D7AIW1_9AGAR|nr:MFS general substrate transporter [Fistulina hepatica ATCC 64428]